MFSAPVQGHDDNGLWVFAFDGVDSHQQRVEGLLADAGLLGQITVVLECQSE